MKAVVSQPHLGALAAAAWAQPPLAVACRHAEVFLAGFFCFVATKPTSLYYKRRARLTFSTHTSFGAKHTSPLLYSLVLSLSSL
jgi:hypothetical protein